MFLDSGQSKERLRNRQVKMNALDEGETLQDTEMTEESSSEEEVSYFLVFSLIVVD